MTGYSVATETWAILHFAAKAARNGGDTLDTVAVWLAAAHTVDVSATLHIPTAVVAVTTGLGQTLDVTAHPTVNVSVLPIFLQVPSIHVARVLAKLRQ